MHSRPCFNRGFHRNQRSYQWQRPPRIVVPAKIRRVLRLDQIENQLDGNGRIGRTLVHAMEPHGIRDPLVETLWKRLQA